MPRAILASVCLLLACLPGCAADQNYTQTQLNALETREFNASFDRTFDAVVAVMFDTGRTIFNSDKRAGFISAGGVGTAGVQIKVDQLAPNRSSVRVSTSSGGQVRVNQEAIDEVLNRIDRRLTTDAPAPKWGRQVTTRRASVPLVALAALLGGCAAPGLTAEQWQALETRPVDGTRDDALRAAAAVMLDEGFMYTLSDGAAGLLRGERIADSYSAYRYARNGGSCSHRNGRLVESVTIWVRPVGPGKSEMRAQFLDCAGQRIANPERVTQIWTYVQQRMLRYAPSKATASAKGGRP